MANFFVLTRMDVVVSWLRYCCSSGVKSFEDLDLKDLNPFFLKDFGFGIDLNPFVFGQNPFAF